MVGASSLSGLGIGRIYTYSNLHPQTFPTIVSSPIIRATVGNLYVYTVEATGPDHHAWRYALRHGPAGMIIDQARGVVTWRPEAPGAFRVQIEIRDAHGAVATQAYRLTVEARPEPTPTESPSPDKASNQAPQIMSSPLTQHDFAPPIPIVAVTDAHDIRHTVWLNGQPYTPGVPITQPGTYQLTVQATDVAGNTAAMTMHFTIESDPLP
jgi:hypothetical protein